MNKTILSIINTVLVFFGTILTRSHVTAAESYSDQTIYDITIEDIHGKKVELSQYKGKVLLFVNVASECGYTPQYEELEKLHQKYKNKGLVIIGIPSNDFGEQEPGTNEEIERFCTRTYNVTFQMMAKVKTKGDEKHPLFTFLTSGQGNTALAGDVAWNFEKFIIDKNGNILSRFRSKIKPSSAECVKSIELALGLL